MTAPSPFAARLTGQALPDILLTSTAGGRVSLASLSGITVVYAYPRTSPPGGTAIPGWDAIPGAKGCTPQSCGFRDHHGDLMAAGVANVFGLSVQDTEYQREVVERLHLPFPILSDSAQDLQRALDLPTLNAGGMVLLARFAMVIDSGTVTQVFHPITDPDGNAEAVLSWLNA